MGSVNDVEVKPGNEARLEFHLGGSPVSKVEWFKNKKPLKVGDDIKYELTDDSCVLFIPNACPNDSGEYRCMVTNDSGSSTSTVQLHVKESTVDCTQVTPEETLPEMADTYSRDELAPMFKEEAQDGSVTGLAGGNVRLEARIGGVPTPIVEWYKDDTPIDIGERFVKVVDNDRYCLEIAHVSPSDSGKYKCVGSNHLGIVTRVYNLDIDGKFLLFISIYCFQCLSLFAFQ